MSHISSLGAAIFTDLSVGTGTITAGIAGGTAVTTLDESTFKSRFADEGFVHGTGVVTGANSFTSLENVREFPQVGTPANIVQVPVFGQRQASTVQGQADAPSLEVTVNYIPSLWTKGASFSNVLGNMVGDGIARPWRFTLLTAAPAVQANATVSSATASTPTAGGGAASGATIVGDLLTVGTPTGTWQVGTLVTGGTTATGTYILEKYTASTFRVNISQNVSAFTPTGASCVMTMNAVPSGWFSPGMAVTGTGWAGATIAGQLTGTIGGSNGATYAITPVTGQTASAASTTGVGSGSDQYASIATRGLSTTQNSQYFWNGKLEAALVKPDLKDAMTATLTLSIQSDFYGAYTNT